MTYRPVTLQKDKCSTGQAAKILNVSTRTLQRWDKAGTLPANRTETGRRFYTKIQLAEFIETHTVLNRSGRTLYVEKK
jgi:excisionase family DNA binding protein